MMARYFLFFALLLFFVPTFSTWALNQVSHLTKPFAGNGSVAVNKQGDIYINEYGKATPDISGSGTRIFKINAQGEISVWREDVNGPVGNIFDSEGNYYYNNGNSIKNSELTVIDTSGEKRVIATLEGFSGDLLLSKDEKSLFIPSYTHPEIRQVWLNGDVSVFMRDERLRGVTGIVYGPDDTIIVSNFTTGAVLSISPDKTISVLAQIAPVYPGYVLGYITYHEGKVYATGYGSNKIYEITLQGEISELAGTGSRESESGIGSEASFVTPNGIDVDTNKQRLIITQNGNGTAMPLATVSLR